MRILLIALLQREDTHSIAAVIRTSPLGDAIERSVRLGLVLSKLCVN